MAKRTLFKVEGVDNAVKRITKVKEVFDDPAVLKEVFWGAADIFAREARRVAPVRTGLLRSEIKVWARAGKFPGAMVKVSGKTVPYAGEVEFGTNTHGKAQPYIRPARDAKTAEAVEWVTEKLSEAIEEAARG